MSIKYKLNKPIRKPAHWSKERYELYLKNNIEKQGVKA